MNEEKRKQGFAIMNPERQREIASQGGKSVDPVNRAYAKNKELARAAGRLGGLANRRRKGKTP